MAYRKDDDREHGMSDAYPEGEGMSEKESRMSKVGKAQEQGGTVNPTPGMSADQSFEAKIYYCVDADVEGPVVSGPADRKFETNQELHGKIRSGV